jgi:hypothetical protein
MTITCHRKTVPLSFHVNSWARNMSDDSNLQKASGPKAPGWFTQPLPESGRRWWFSGCDQFQIPALSFISSAPSERCVRRPDLGETKNDETGSNIEENRDMNSWDITWWFYHQPKYVNVHKNHTQSSFICACMDIQIYIYTPISTYIYIHICTVVKKNEYQDWNLDSLSNNVVSIFLGNFPGNGLVWVAMVMAQCSQGARSCRCLWYPRAGSPHVTKNEVTSIASSWTIAYSIEIHHRKNKNNHMFL